MSFGRQLKVLVRKNFIIKKRLWKQTIWDFIVPMLFSYIIGLAASNSGGQPMSTDIGKIYLISTAITLAFQ